MSYPFRALVGFGFGLATLSTAYAELVMWEARGTIDSIFKTVTPLAAFGISVGDEFTLTFLADSSSTPFSSDLETASYAITNARAVVGPQEFQLDDASQLTIADNTPFYHAFFFGGYAAPFNVGLSLAGEATGESGLAIPASIRDLASYNVDRSLSLSFRAGKGTWNAYAEIDELTIKPLTTEAVPEPGTYGLIGVGVLAGLALVRRLRDRRADARTP